MLKVREAIEVMKRNSLIIEKKMIINNCNKEKTPFNEEFNSFKLQFYSLLQK